MDRIEEIKYLERMTFSARDRLTGRIVELQLGGVMAHVVVKVGENPIESVIAEAEDGYGRIDEVRLAATAVGRFLL